MKHTTGPRILNLNCNRLPDILLVFVIPCLCLLVLITALASAASQANPSGGSGDWTEVVRSNGGAYGWQTLDGGRWYRVPWDAYHLHLVTDTQEAGSAHHTLPEEEAIRHCDSANGDSASGCPWYTPLEPSLEVSATVPPPTDRQSRTVYLPFVSRVDPFSDLADWWKPDYDDSHWPGEGWVDWNTWWSSPPWGPIPAIGKYAWTTGPRPEGEGWNETTDLHRRVFALTSAVGEARITVFSDNKSRWYVNGLAFTPGDRTAREGGPWTYSIPAVSFRCGKNVLAAQVNNDDVSFHSDPDSINPFGMQYLLEVSFGRRCAELKTTATASEIVNRAIGDVAHLRVEGADAPSPSGTITFEVFGPDDASCASPTPVPPAIAVNGAGDYASGDYTPTLPGDYRWIAHYSGDTNYEAASTACNDPNETSSVYEEPLAVATLTTTATASETVNRAIGDVAHLRLEGVDAPSPSGSITFEVFGPDDASCASPTVVPPAIAVNGAGDYASGSYTPTLPGDYRWIAHYSGDAYYDAVSTACNDPNETTSVYEAQAELSGRKYDDRDTNGRLNSGDAGLANWNIEISCEDGTQATVRTDDNGDWSFVVPLRYPDSGMTTCRIREIQQAEYRQTGNTFEQFEIDGDASVVLNSDMTYVVMLPGNAASRVRGLHFGNICLDERRAR